ncbi:hypothetical protein, partial [Roseiarcus sp.]|uniref:hypothetical protein n=1 Tax=Roseiarcus sp. TaxID=1969460 RepID=UPI003F96FBE8
GPGIRGPFASEPARLEAMLLGMQGLGKPGVHQAKMIEWWIWREYYPLPYQGTVKPQLATLSEAVRPAGSSNPFEMVPSYMGNHPEMIKLTQLTATPPTQAIPKCLVHDAILNPPVTWWGLHHFLEGAEEQFTTHTFPAPGCSEIHMIWTDSPCWITCWNDSNTYVQALQKPSIECIVAMHPWLENDCRPRRSGERTTKIVHVSRIFVSRSCTAIGSELLQTATGSRRLALLGLFLPDLGVSY